MLKSEEPMKGQKRSRALGTVLPSWPTSADNGSASGVSGRVSPFPFPPRFVPGQVAICYLQPRNSLIHSRFSGPVLVP